MLAAARGRRREEEMQRRQGRRREKMGGGGRQERMKKMTCGAYESVIGERVFNAIYVFIYTCSWAHVVFIRIPCHFCEK